MGLISAFKNSTFFKRREDIEADKSHALAEKIKSEQQLKISNEELREARKMDQKVAEVNARNHFSETFSEVIVGKA